MRAKECNDELGGLTPASGRYMVKVNVNVCIGNGRWSAKGLATIEDKWDFDWTLKDLIAEWREKRRRGVIFRNGELNLGGRETRTALGSAIPGDPFEVRSQEMDVTQGDNHREMVFK